MQLVPRRVDEIVVAHRERGADEELLVGGGAACVVGADQVPGELEQLHAVHRGKFSGGPEGVEQLAQPGILDHLDAGRDTETGRRP